MSIWGCWETIGTDVRTRLAKDDTGKPILVKSGRQPEPQRGIVRSYASGFSNHYPTTDGTVEQPANVGISHIPAWCVPGHDPRSEMDERYGEWVRLDIQTCEHDWASGGKPTMRYDLTSIVMDETAARALAADLLAWADAEKAQPKTDPAGVPNR